VLAKYIDIFAGTISFWLFGYAISGNTTGGTLGEEQDFIFWFFRFTFASNTATIIGGTLVGSKVQLRVFSVFIYSFLMTGFIHPILARFFWAAGSVQPFFGSPYRYCNGSFIFNRQHTFQVSQESTAGLGEFLFIDFAGSGLVHVCGGMAGFVLAVFHKFETTEKIRSKVQDCCPLLSRKEKRPKTESVAKEKKEEVVHKKGFLEWMYPSGGGDENVESAALGILILWTTWFAFNCGSTESISGKANHAAVGRIALVMSIAAASGGLVQAIISGLVQIYKRDENYNTNEIANGILASLVAVTGCCPFIQPYFAVIIGALTIIIYHLGCLIEYLLGLHDGARVFPVHAVCGFWGVLCVGIFSRTCLIRELYEGLCFCCTSMLPDIADNQGVLLGYQVVGGLFIITWSFIFCLAIFGLLWFFPVKFILTCLPWVCKFENDERGRISFKGNILFTHFGEIGVPMQTISIPHEIDMATINAMAKVSVNNDDKVDVKDEP
jgi:Amt family ammonium transporter